MVLNSSTCILCGIKIAKDFAIQNVKNLRHFYLSDMSLG